MSRRKHFVILALFSIGIFYGQTSYDLPYNELPKHSINNTSFPILASKVLDTIGHKYFWATDSLDLKDLSHSFQSDQLPRLLMNGMFIMSLKMSDLTQNRTSNLLHARETMGFHEFRDRTLFRIKSVSDHLLDNKESIVDINWVAFFNLIDGMRQYNDKITEYRKSIGLTLHEILDEKEENKSYLEVFEEQLGADGLTNNQWKQIMEAGGGPDGHAKIARQNRRNNKTISEIRKITKVSLDVGELEEIKPYSKTVEDLKYTYYIQPPRQMSFVYESDLNILIGLTEWIISINAGRPANLSEIFRIGLSNELHIYEEQVIGTLINTREIIDNDDNSIALKIDKRYIDGDTFWDIPLDEVRIMKNDVIEFIRQSPKKSPFGNKEVVVLSITNLKGSLLKRVKDFVKASRDGNISQNTSSLRLKRN